MMRRRFRRRRRRPSWVFANAQSMTLNSSTNTLGGQPIDYAWLLPPARGQFLMDTQGRDSITFAGAHVWMDFYWRNENSGALALPDVDFGVIKTTIFDPSGANPDLTQVVGQWDQPATPATLTSWEGDEDDGTESFLWSHHIKGFTPPNAVVNVLNTGLSAGADHAGNQANLIDAGSSDKPIYVCRKFNVTQEWQPDLVVRSKRRLQKGEGILLFMVSDAAITSNLSCILNLRYRTLAV